MNTDNPTAGILSTRLPAEMKALGRLTSFIIEYAKKQGLEDQIIWELELAADEILTNIIRYAYPQETGIIEVRCGYDDSRGVVVEIIDYGIPFSPLSHPVPDCPPDISRTRPNGFGIHIFRCLFDEITYKREGSMNCLTVKKKTRALL